MIMPKKLTQDEFISRCYAKYGDKFSYDKVKYEGKDIKVIVTCKLHGDFEVTPRVFLKNVYGCPMCAKMKSFGHRKKYKKKEGYRRVKTFDDVLKKIQEIHGDKFQIELVGPYIGIKSKIRVLCPTHGTFEIGINNFLRSKHGCPQCAKDASAEIFIKRGVCYTTSFEEEARKVHGNIYDYSLANYTTRTTKVQIICPQHGVFIQSPGLHLKGEGCPICKTKGVYITQQRIGEILKNKFPTVIVKEQYRNKEILGRQSLDFYLPEYKLAIEYHGRQHFIKNAWFEDYRHSLAHRQELDFKKYTKCNNSGIKIIYVTLWHDYEDGMYFEHVYTSIDEMLDIIRNEINQYNETII